MFDFIGLDLSLSFGLITDFHLKRFPDSKDQGRHRGLAWQQQLFSFIDDSNWLS
jgi:hypothetical protein